VASIPQRSPEATPGFVALEGGDARVEVVPAHGGRIRSLRIAGREWLAQAPTHTGPQQGESPLAGAGWDECAPAAGGGTVPEWVKGCGGRPIPIGGEARLQPPEIAVHTDDSGNRLTCTWRGERMPWKLTRTLLVRPDGAVEARYEATTSGAQRLPFLWSANLLMPLVATTHLKLPDAGRFRVAAIVGATSGGGLADGSVKWPRITLDGKPRDLSAPWSVPRKAMVTGWLDLANTRASIQVVQDTARLTISSDGAGVPHCGVMIDRGGMASGKPRSTFARRAAPVLAIRPSLGAPDRYTEALGDWQSITWLVPGEPRRWTLTLRASPTDGMAH
jgi:hypothetical protein